MTVGVGPREIAAILAARAAGGATRLLRRGGGTALPGLVAERIAPAILQRMTRQLRRGTIIVTGTNGKTTTSRMLGAILHAAGWRTIHNRSGSNLVRGLIATVVQSSNAAGHLHADAALFEVDEATVPAVAAQVRPRLLVINNLFRDQLDRYGEIDTVARRWRETLGALDGRSTVLLNADDPGVAALGRHTGAQVRYYGVADTRQALAVLPHAADAIDCPICDHRLVYSAILLSHLGHYACSQCGFTRPTPDIVAETVELLGTEAARLTVRSPQGHFTVQIALPGFYNAYNGLAATAAALLLGLGPAVIGQGLGQSSAAFGRIERVRAGDTGKSLLLALVKNPVGFNEVLRMLFPPEPATSPPAPPLQREGSETANPIGAGSALGVPTPPPAPPLKGEGSATANPIGKGSALETPPPPSGEGVGGWGQRGRHLLIILNDLTADGRDVSWLWDVDFEVLIAPGRVAQVTCAGLRATDMANRLKYAGLAPAQLRVIEDLEPALEATLAALPPGDTLYVLPTYTAMLAFRALLQDRGWVAGFWEQ